ncbi:hypothetical protein SCOCK_20161 [Actinacidiphila cocklensis]|uniref:Uncharacterized protein n=1 Tax=Actinacidiphila cocklensis TaxID=887465 RepID=A0A9W4DNE1_9ACTN|nr:hypothetical protein SCOCK_20161 [Actinacidiphila cocklensis]
MTVDYYFKAGILSNHNLPHGTQILGVQNISVNVN